MYVCMPVCIYVCMYVWMDVCMYVYTCTYKCMYVYVCRFYNNSSGYTPEVSSSGDLAHQADLDGCHGYLSKSAHGGSEVQALHKLAV